MKVVGKGTETYLFLNGISTSKEILLREGVYLVPLTGDFNCEKVSNLLKNDVDYAVAAVSGRTIAAQIRINAVDEKQLTISVWNSLWDCILLGALFQCEVMGNLQCDMPIEKLEKAEFIHITNYAFRAILSEPYCLKDDDIVWMLHNYSAAYKMLEQEPFRIAVHALSSYRWHSLPRVQLAVIWSGIEALFEANYEISFRISLYITNFLSGHNSTEAKELFKRTRELYSSRSAAVHGGKIKGDINILVSESASLLNQIIKRCAELRKLPDIDNLVFPW